MCLKMGISCVSKLIVNANDVLLLMFITYQVSKEEMDLLGMVKAALRPTPFMGTHMPPLLLSLGVQTLLISSLDVKPVVEMMRIWRWMEMIHLDPTLVST